MRPIYRCPRCGSFTESETHCGVPAALFLPAEKRVRLSKLMSGALRHFPRSLGVELSPEGFAPLRELASAISRVEGFEWVTEEHLRAVAETDPKGRFEVRGGAIRAVYGHSVRVRVAYPEEYPAQPLYHGTSASKLPSILRSGLLPMRRLYVHLTTVFEDALARARRYPDPVVLAVDPGCLRGRVKLFRAGRTVYVARRVPPECIQVLFRQGGA